MKVSRGGFYFLTRLRGALEALLSLILGAVGEKKAVAFVTFSYSRPKGMTIS